MCNEGKASIALGYLKGINLSQEMDSGIDYIHSEDYNVLDDMLPKKETGLPKLIED